MFDTIDLQISDSKKEIDDYIESGYQYAEKIKHHYSRSLVLLIVSEYEVLIENVFISRASKCNDQILINYIKNQINKKFRSPDIRKINEILKAFDENFYVAFCNKINNTPSHTAWDNLLRARHSIVHKQGSLNLTYEEVVSSYQETKNILIELASLIL